MKGEGPLKEEVRYNSLSTLIELYTDRKTWKNALEIFEGKYLNNEDIFMSLFSSSQQFYGYVYPWVKPSSEGEDSFNQSPLPLQLCSSLLVKSMDGVKVL